MDVSLFDFDLPDDCIALRPAEPGDAARLLVVPAGNGVLADRAMMDLPELLRPDDVLVVNDTRVVAAELHGVR
ncbi:MAG: S-adenosylmethionine:tRNA ribosyltransferase-isomerase, partial [Hyphomicrobiaceae bacterium]